MGINALRGRRRIVIAAFLFIPLALFAAFSLYPAIRLINISFTKWDGISPTMEYIGLSNYREAITSPIVQISLRNNMIYFLVECVELAFAMFLALILTSKIRFKKVFRSWLFIPYVLNMTAVAFMFRFMYGTEGVLNVLLQGLGFDRVGWLSNPAVVNYSLAMVVFWKSFGFYMVLNIAAIQAVPSELYESSSIDGANAWHNFRYITFPALSEIIKLQLFLIFAGSLQRYLEPVIMTGEGGPGNSSMTFALLSIRTAFRFRRYGLAASMAVILIFIILTAQVLQRVVFKTREVKYD